MTITVISSKSICYFPQEFQSKKRTKVRVFIFGNFIGFFSCNLFTCKVLDPKMFWVQKGFYIPSFTCYLTWDRTTRQCRAPLAVQLHSLGQPTRWTCQRAVATDSLADYFWAETFFLLPNISIFNFVQLLEPRWVDGYLRTEIVGVSNRQAKMTSDAISGERLFKFSPPNWKMKPFHSVVIFKIRLNKKLVKIWVSWWN